MGNYLIYLFFSCFDICFTTPFQNHVHLVSYPGFIIFGVLSFNKSDIRHDTNIDFFPLYRR